MLLRLPIFHWVFSFNLESAQPSTQAAASTQAAEPIASKSAPVSAPSVASVKSDRLFASPIAKVQAAAKGINLSSVSPSGPNGRITKFDVDQFKPAPVSAVTPAVVPIAAHVPAASPSSGFTDAPTSNIRKVIAQRLTQSKVTIPHYQLSVEVTMDKLMRYSFFNKKFETIIKRPISRPVQIISE